MLNIGLDYSRPGINTFLDLGSFVFNNQFKKRKFCLRFVEGNYALNKIIFQFF